MSLGKIVEPLLQEDTQKEQNVAITEKDARAPGMEQTNKNHPHLVETNAGDRQPGEPDPGRQAGGTRAFNANAERTGKGLEEPQEAHQGSVTTRTPEGAKQGISNASSTEDAQGQKKVVEDRPDAQAGVNHDRT